MTEPGAQSTGTLSRRTVILMIAAAGALMLAAFTGFSVLWAAVVITFVTEGALAGLIVAGAGGYGNLIVRRIAPSAPTALRVCTACALGLWMLSTGMLVIGGIPGALSAWVWWPIVGVGAVLAAVQGKGVFERWRLPRQTDGRALLWVLLAGAGALWIAGATEPPGILGRFMGDFYDVLEYHLQVPREFFHQGRIVELPHNCYSYYPLGVEMIFLMSMCLRGGAYEGMYLAQIMHGVFGVLTVAAIFSVLKKDDENRARFSAGLYGTTAYVLYLSWLAMVELAVMAYLALALLWLRQWVKDRSPRSALCLGAMLGASCAMKYLSVGLVAGPVVVAMVVVGLLSRRLEAGTRESPPDLVTAARHLVLVGVAAIIPICPWLIRNAVYTGNPVFPLATETLGRGPNWTAECQQRWVDGTGPGIRPPVPPPSGWQERTPPERAIRFFHQFLAWDWFGTIMLIIAGVAICFLIAQKGPPDAWNWSLVIVLAVQLLVWTFATHDMQPRFITPAIVPIALLAGGVLSRLSHVEVNPFRKNAARPAAGPWGLVPAVAVFVVAVGQNLLVGYGMLVTDTAGAVFPGVPGQALAQHYASAVREGTSERVRVMFVGEARPFYFPPDTLYATAFDEHPLDRMVRGGLTGPQVRAELESLGVTHLWVNWFEIWRLARTYGYPESLSAELFERQKAGRPPSLKVLEEIEPAGRIDDTLSFRPVGYGQADPNSGPVWPAVTIFRLHARATTGPASGPATAPAGGATTASRPTTSPPGGATTTSGPTTSPR